MKIGIISDTHDHMDRTREAVNVFRENGVTHVVHCGDLISPFVVPVLRAGKFESCHAVFGNNDGEWLMLAKFFEMLGSIAKPPVFTQIESIRIAILHEPMPMDIMESMPVDIVAFGHTHEPVIKPGKPLIVNPGECCGYLSGRATVVIVETDDMKAELIELE